MHLLRLTLRFTSDAHFPFLHGRIIYAALRQALALPDSEPFPSALIPWASESGRVFYPAGTPYALGLTLFSPELAWPIAEGLDRLGSDEILAGHHQLGGNFRVEAVEDLIAGTTLPPGQEPAAFTAADLSLAVDALAGRDSLRLRFISPLRLPRSSAAKRHGHAFCDGDLFEASRLISSLVARVPRLFGSLAPPEPPPREAADEMEATVRHLFWLDLPKANQAQTTGGAVGEVVIHHPGGLDPWLPYLVLGQYAGAGKDSSFGFGHYRILEDGFWPALPVRAQSLARAAAELPPNATPASPQPEDWPWEDDDLDALTEAPWEEEAIGEEELLALSAGKRRPGTLKGVVALNHKGKARALAIPASADQALQRRVHDLLAPAVDELLETSSHAYRAGHSRQGAAAALRKAREDGLGWVLRADISAFFDRVDWDILRLKLEALWDGDPLVDQIMAWVSAPVRFDRATLERRLGLPQGAVLSPLLANLYLDQFDEAVAQAGFRLVRFADDFVICCRDEQAAAKALEAARAALGGLKLELNPDKSRLTSFDEGFSYLGYLFCRSVVLEEEGKRPKPQWLDELEDAAPEFWLRAAAEAGPGNWLAGLDPEELRPLTRQDVSLAQAWASRSGRGQDRTPLFLTGQGCRLKAFGGRLTIQEPGTAEPTELPLSLLSSITILGQVHLDQYVLRACLRHNVPLHICTQAGALLGTLNLPGDAPSASLALAQADFCRDEGRCLALAREMIARKIANCREVLSRQRERDQFDELALAELKQAGDEARRAGSAGALRGIEGRAASIYFDRWQKLIPAELAFAGRSSRPAEDPLNALLNFGYALLYRQISGLLQIERLNPHLGVFHRPSDYYHPLACDVQEEFRCLVDLMALRLVHLGQVGRGDFIWREKPRPGWWLGEEARRVVIKHWQRRLEEPYRPVEGREETTLRRVMHHQARKLREHIQEPDKKTYQSFRLA